MVTNFEALWILYWWNLKSNLFSMLTINAYNLRGLVCIATIFLAVYFLLLQYSWL